MAFKWLSAVIGFFYMVLGVFVIWKKWFFNPLEDFTSYALGALLIAYGLFRIIRAMYKVKQDTDEE
ncbi:C4-dicarboxylate ABC transporter [Frigoriflavimonas asaccharolytica]|uniref:Putative membrane protein n=1 Tax=Frigoriflavimonas asaccharolytica TaxID=2735899 RepID=A0A8J8G9N4_9FLAO|nr:C4-dicarboxylate ABC transporter [Frigoriflavimonas asaccharolytica]NRS93456.1 putative membrane protein [Frigoriflavimonas asaccharolytica]